MRKKEEAAISLLLTLAVPAVLFLLLAVQRAAVRARDDLFTARAAAAGVESELAAFSRELYRDFGLFASPVNGEGAALAAHLMVPGSSATLHIEPLQPLGESERMLSEIVRHMKIRAPLQVGLEVMRRVMKFQYGGGLTVSGGSLNANITALTETFDVRATTRDLGGLFDQLPEEERGALQKLIDGEITRLYESLLTELMPVHLYTPGLDHNGDFFDPNTLTGLASWFDGLFIIPRLDLYDRFAVSEYALSYFHHRTPALYAAYGLVPLRTPDGRELSLLPVSRRYEVEQIITGKSPEKAKQEVRDTIFTLRAIVHLCSNFSNLEKRAQFMGRASFLSGAISLLSLGSVTVPPETLVYLFLLADAVQSGKREADRLTQGFAVPFWPDHSLFAVDLYYPDYLRLLLLLSSPERLAERIYQQIAAVHPGPHYTGLSLSLARESDKVTFSGSLRGRDSE